MAILAAGKGFVFFGCGSEKVQFRRGLAAENTNAWWVAITYETVRSRQFDGYCHVQLLAFVWFVLFVVGGEMGCAQGALTDEVHTSLTRRCKGGIDDGGELRRSNNRQLQ